MTETVPFEPSAILLTRELAETHAEVLAALASQIPEVDYTVDDILAEQKGERVLHEKWAHSFVMIGVDQQPIAFVMGYEREAEGNAQYPENTLYISEIAVAPDHQGRGIARKLLKDFFVKNNATGFLSLDGDLNYSVQTNSADWNSHVAELYRSFGFQERTHKEYPNRVDVVLGASATDIIL